MCCCHHGQAASPDHGPRAGVWPCTRPSHEDGWRQATQQAARWEAGQKTPHCPAQPVSRGRVSPPAQGTPRGIKDDTGHAEGARHKGHQISSWTISFLGQLCCTALAETSLSLTLGLILQV